MAEITSGRESTLRVDGPIAEFTHQRPQTRNAMSMALREDYACMLQRITGDLSIRVLILTGTGGSFCSGGDIKGMRSRLDQADPDVHSPDATRRRLQESHRWLSQLHDLDLPVIAAVDGAAYGAGFALALQADFVLASTEAAFAMSFARMGAVPDYGALHILPRIVGLARAKELMLTGRRVGAHEAQALGFVHAVHEPPALLPAARSLAARLAQGPREAAALTKSLLNRSFETDYGTMCAFEAYAQGLALHTPYHAAAAARFVSGERPSYDWDAMPGH
ncbi:enoyl-CoA hydratase/isomerase family protein [Achromobacter denitrificans]|uniref:enoyl-CoA hydratase/isomerase family protein n=1 Tax=Achromobacter denitrificans TaxID=32002 RepID=UPI0023E887D0|nr:enoyl-CoA hydratase/isomerase family protein [Achromobacter denitrificans]MDF3860807.1 enoyl-CoA hydratase/isomerase family protein [Achromobacter denitrificans]